MVKKIAITVLVTTLIVIFFLGFIDRNYTEPIKSTADVTYSIDSIPTNIKSISSLTTREQDIICATSRGLIEIDPNGKIIPSLAEAVEIRDNGIEYDFTIRDDIYWSDGSKITPSDIVSFFREVLTEEDSDKIEVFLSVFGAKEFVTTNKSFNETVGIKAVDNRVIIRLNNAEPTFLQELSKPQYRVRKDVLLWENLAKNYKQLPYSGNYKIIGIEKDQLILERSGGADSKIPQTIHIVKDDGEDLALAAFEVGERDIVLNPPRSQLERLNSESKLVKNTSNKGTYLVFNPNNTTLSVDGRREIYKDINEALQSYAISNKSYLQLADGSYFRDDSEDLSKLQSRKVMASSKGEEIKLDEVVLVAEENLKNKELTEYMKKWFNDNTDITLVVTLVKEDDMANIKDKTYYNVAMIDTVASTNDKRSFYQNIYDFIPNNIKSEYDIKKEVDSDNQLESEIEDNLFSTYSVLPLVFYYETVAINKEIENISFDGNGNLVFDMVKN